jgi:hypothetical protein
MRANPLASQIAGEKDNLGRLIGDAYLHAPEAKNIFVTGDTVKVPTDDLGNFNVMSCQHAMSLGRVAGYNAAAELVDLPLHPYSQPKYVTCVDLGPWGALYTEGWDRQVQFVREEAKKIKQEINTVWIYPPVAEGATPIIQSTGSKKSSKVFRGGLTEKATPENSGPAPAMTPAERFVPSASGLLRRESSRQLKPPARLDEDDPEAIMNRCMDKCRTILQEMNNADVQKIFAAPVNPKALGIPTYFAVIKDPMDLGSIKTMMDNDEIDSPEEFARLVRLTFENAITFNTLPDNIVHVQARNLLALFTKKFGTIDKTFNSARKNKTLSKAERQEQRRKEKDARKDAQKKEKKEKERKRRAEIEASNESKRMKLENVLAANKAAMAAIADAVPNNPNADVTRTEFNLLLVALRNVQGQIVGLHKLIKKASSNPASSANAADNLVPAPSYDDEPAHDNAGDASYQPPKAKKKKVKKESESSISPPPSPKQSQASVVENLQPLTFEEQEALSDAINLLPERLLPDAMNIIRESDFVNDDDDEIDLDIDQLDTRTQRKLQRFVMEVRLPSMVFCDFANETFCLI